MNPELTKVEKEIMDQVMPLQGKLIKTKTYGDGEIHLITRKNDLSGIFVYFRSYQNGEIKLDGKNFLNEIKAVQES